MAEDDDRPSDGCDRNSDSNTDLTATIDDQSRKRAVDLQPSSSGACLYAGDFGQVSVCCTGTNGIHRLTDASF